MNMTADLFPSQLYWAAHLLYVLVIAWAVWSAPWYKLRQEGNLNVFLGATVLLLLLWNLKAGIHPGLSFHLLGATLLMLMFGWQFALFSISLILLGEAFYGIIDWPSFTLNALLMGAIPSLLSFAIFRLSLRFLPHHFFVYTLFNGYVTGALVMLLTILIATALLLCCSPYEWEDLRERYLPFIPMFTFAEAFITGMLTTSMVLFRPEWIGSFDDRRYLKGK